MSTFPETATQKKAGVSRLCGSTTSGTPRTRWTPWTARFWTDGSCESRWPGTADPQILTTAAVVAEEEEAVEEGRPGGTAAMDAGAEAQDTEDAAGPAAGAALVPEADPATADPGPGPTPDPSLTLPGTRRLRPNPSLVPDLDPGPGPSPSPNPGQEAAPRPLKEGPDRDLKASLSPQQKMEGNPHRAQHKFSGEDWKL